MQGKGPGLQAVSIFRGYRYTSLVFSGETCGKSFDMNELVKIAHKRRDHNYAGKWYKNRYKRNDILEAIDFKYKLMLRNPDYRDRYKHLAIYDDEINFLLENITLDTSG